MAPSADEKNWRDGRPTSEWRGGLAMQGRNNRGRTARYTHVRFRGASRARWAATSLSLSFVFLAQLPAWAQEDSRGMLSRSAQIEQERQKKAAQLKPDEPDKGERAFIKGKRVLNLVLLSPPAGIRPKFSSSAPGWGGLVLVRLRILAGSGVLPPRSGQRRNGLPSLRHRDHQTQLPV